MPKTQPANKISDAAVDADVIWTLLQPRIEAMLQRKVDALQRRIEARLAGRLGASLPDLYDALDPMVRQMVKHKNDVQDDAIIGIGAKVDAQDEAIQSLAEQLRQVLGHPIFRR